LAAPELALHSEVYLGTPLSGPTTRPTPAITTAPTTAAATSAAPLAVDVNWYFAAIRFSGESQSLGSRASLVVASDEVRPWQATPRQLADVRVISGESALTLAEALASAPATAAAPVEQQTGVLKNGLTALFRLDRGPEAGALLVFLTPTDPDPESGNPRLELAVASETPEGRETVLTAWPTDLGGPGKLVLRFPGGPAEGRSPSADLFLVLGVRRADVDGRDAELAAAAEAVLSGTAHPTTQAAGIGLPGSSEVAFSGAVHALAVPEARRAALAFLAREMQASLTEEVALSAEDELLGSLCDRLSERWQPGHPAAPAMAFELESETLTVLAELEDAGSLPPGMRTLLTLHAGEAGRRAASLEEVLGAARTLSGLRARLAAENAIYLEDNDPAARVRAYEWLAARNLAPAGYDPLAPVEARRAALEAAMSATAQPQTRPSPVPPED
jgi:hypothetical protein